ncbi:hypothetical protein Hanom_Chr12g01120211 [Helianthus anomalus]
MYKMNGSDKLYSDEEFLIQNVNLNKFETIFMLVEVDISEIDNLSTTEIFLNFKKDKSYYSKPKNSYSKYQNRNFNNGRNETGYGQ